MATPTTGLSTHIWNNNLKSIMLLTLYPLLILGMVWLVALALGMSFQRQSLTNVYKVYTDPANSAYIDPAPPAMDTEYSIDFANNILIDFAPLVITGVAIWFIIAWFFHTSMIRKLAHSHPVSRQDEPQLYNLLENLCIAEGMTMPRLEIIETHARNAFASGINEKSFTVTITRGLMNSLSRDELEAVIAHELTHIQNRDVRLLIITVIFTGLFGFLAQLIWSNIRYSIFYSSRRTRSQNSGGAAFAMVVIAVILWLGYMASLVMRFALSRRREYMADAGAIRMTKNPEAMMRALMRIAGRDRIPETTDDIAMMCIENHVPFMGMFATHPPIEKRIKAISEVTRTPVPDLPSLPPVVAEERFTVREDRGSSRNNPWLTRGRRM